MALAFLLLVPGTVFAETFFVVLKTKDMNGLGKVVARFKADGVRVPHLYPPSAMVVEAASEKVFIGAGEVVAYFKDAIQDGDISNVADNNLKLLMQAWNYGFTPQGKKALAITEEGLQSAAENCGGARERPNKVKWALPSPTVSKVVTSYPYKATAWETSEYMIGSTSIKVFHEQHATKGSWTDPEITTSMAVCQAALKWWSDKYPELNLTFVWHFETIAAGAFTWPSATEMDNLRNADKTDWVYYVERPHDPDGRSYAYLGGPYTCFYMDPRGAVVLSHETGHIYNSMDEYCPDACIPKTGRYGYLKELNSNSDAGGVTGISCMMKNLTGLCDFTKNQLGWRDTNANKIPDIIEVKPKIYDLVTPANPANYEPFQVKAGVVAYPQTLSNGTEGTLVDGYHDITINKIKSVSFRIDGGSWGSCSPVDGAFDDQIEEVTFIPIAQTLAASHTVEIMTTDTADNVSDIFSFVATEVPGQIPPSFVKVYPNPFNPTKERANIFSGAVGISLEAYVYSLSGEKLRTLSGTDVDLASGMVRWDGKTDSGDTCKSGLYLIRVKGAEKSATGKVLIIIN